MSLFGKISGLILEPDRPRNPSAENSFIKGTQGPNLSLTFEALKWRSERSIHPLLISQMHTKMLTEIPHLWFPQKRKLAANMKHQLSGGFVSDVEDLRK